MPFSGSPTLLSRPSPIGLCHHSFTMESSLGSNDYSRFRQILNDAPPESDKPSQILEQLFQSTLKSFGVSQM